MFDRILATVVLCLVFNFWLLVIETLTRETSSWPAMAMATVLTIFTVYFVVGARNILEDIDKNG
jgi:hypothetical protein